MVSRVGNDDNLEKLIIKMMKKNSKEDKDKVTKLFAIKNV